MQIHSIFFERELFFQCVAYVFVEFYRHTERLSLTYLLHFRNFFTVFYDSTGFELAI